MRLWIGSEESLGLVTDNTKGCIAMKIQELKVANYFFSRQDFVLDSERAPTLVIKSS